MKKYIWLYLISFCLLFFVFSAIYYFSYRNLEQEKELIEGEKGDRIRFETINAETETEALIEAEKKDGTIVTEDMLYISQNYNEKTQMLTETILPMPKEYLGLTREELASLLKRSDSEKSLISFSSSRLVIRSEEEINPEDYKFLLTLEEGYLKIYYSDKSDVYMDTYLTEEEIPESEIDVLKNGYYIKSVKELYDYLESITS